MIPIWSERKGRKVVGKWEERDTNMVRKEREECSREKERKRCQYIKKGRNVIGKRIERDANICSRAKGSGEY